MSSNLLDKLKGKIWSQLFKKEQTNTEDTSQLRRQIAKLDKKITTVLKDLRRTPNDLYDLAAADIRRICDQRDHMNAQLASEENVLDSHEANIDDAANQVLKQLYKLNDTVKVADPRVARGALQTIVERIDLWFEHQHLDKITRSTFKKGLVTFKTSESCDQPSQQY